MTGKRCGSERSVLLGPGARLEESPGDGAADTLLGWLSTYVPSWGTSVMFHAALLLMAVFVGWQHLPAAQGYDVTAGVADVKPFKPAVRRQPPVEWPRDPSLQPLNEKPYVFAPPQDEPTPGIGELDDAPLIDLFGIGGERKGRGNVFSTGCRGPTFFDLPTRSGANKIVYVVDKSGSMTDSIDYVKFELKRAIGELDAGKTFHVVFYSSGPALEMPTRRLVDATDRNKRRAFDFIDGVVAGRQTDPSDALRRAFAVRPEVIYLLSDGEFDRAIVGLVRRLNVDGKVQVNTIGFLYDVGEPILREIAGQNGGRYKFVAERDLTGR